MKEISIVQFILPDGRLVLQRRDEGIKISPGLLGLFGGHVEVGESPADALLREISEETSLNVSDLNIDYIAGRELPHPNDFNSKIMVHFNKAIIGSDDFKVFEGQHAETYSITELKERQDLSPNAKYMINNFI